jgi:hypothetical protein
MLTVCRFVTVGSLRPAHQYRVVHAERVITQFVFSVLIAISYSPTTSVEMFLLKRYGDVQSHEDIEDMHLKRVLLYLIYKGTCAESNMYILELQRQKQ